MTTLRVQSITGRRDLKATGMSILLDITLQKLMKAERRILRLKRRIRDFADESSIQGIFDHMSLVGRTVKKFFDSPYTRDGFRVGTIQSYDKDNTYSVYFSQDLQDKMTLEEIINHLYVTEDNILAYQKIQ